MPSWAEELQKPFEERQKERKDKDPRLETLRHEYGLDTPPAPPVYPEWIPAKTPIFERVEPPTLQPLTKSMGDFDTPVVRSKYPTVEGLFAEGFIPIPETPIS